MKFNRDSVKINSILLILFLINPVVSLIGSTFVMYLKKVNTSLVVALSLALVLVYFPIMYDTSSNFFVYYYNYKIDNLYLSLPKLINDFLNIELDFMFYIYIYTVFIIYVWSDMIYNGLVKNESLKSLLYGFLLFWFVFTYRDVMDLHRTMLSFSIFFYYFNFYFKTHKNNYLFLIISIFLSVNFHSSVIFLWSIYLVSNLISLNLKTAKFLFLSSVILGFVLPSFLSAYFSNISFGIPLFDKFMFYIFSEYWGVREELSIGGFIKKSLEYCIIIVLFFLLFSYKSHNAINIEKNKFIFNFAVIISSMTVLFFSYVTIFERFSLAVFFLSVYLILNEYINDILKFVAISLIVVKSSILFVFVYSVIFFGDYSQVLPDSNSKIEMLSKPFLLPTIMLIDIEENGYSNRYIYNNSIWYRE